MKKLSLLLVLAMFCSSCATVPVTGRRSLVLVSDGEVSSLATSAYGELLKKSKLANDSEMAEMVRRVGKKIAAVSDEPDFKWEYNVIDEPQTVNAFCMPGGKVAFYTGILAVCKTEAGIAVVMGHEVAHAIAKHGAERMSQQMLIQLGGMTLDQALKAKPEQTRALAAQAFGLGVGLGYVLPYGRKQESEADRIGLVYMARAGYDPREAIEFWKRMDKAGGGNAPPEFLSTHPHHDTRIKDIQSWLPEAMQEYEKSKTK